MTNSLITSWMWSEGNISICLGLSVRSSPPPQVQGAPSYHPPISAASLPALSTQKLQPRGQAAGQSVLANFWRPAAGSDLLWSRPRLTFATTHAARQMGLACWALKLDSALDARNVDRTLWSQSLVLPCPIGRH